MNLYYKIIFLRVKGPFTPCQIAMLLDEEIRHSRLNRKYKNGLLVKHPPLQFVQNVLANEFSQVWELDCQARFENNKAM